MKDKLLVLSLIFYSTFLFAQSRDVKILKHNINDLVYVPQQDRLYGSMAGGPENGNSLCIINPYFGNVEKCYYVGSEPRTLALSPDNRYIYIGLNGERRLLRFNIETESIDSTHFNVPPFKGHVRDIEWSTNFPDNPIIVEGEIGQGNISTYLKTLGNNAIISQLKNTDIRTFCPGGGNTFYGANSSFSRVDLLKFNITPDTIVLAENFEGFLNGLSGDIEYYDGRLYTSQGRIINVAEDIPEIIGRFNLSASFRSIFEVIPDSELIFFAAKKNRVLVISIFNRVTFEMQETFEIPLDVEYLYEMISWGQGKVAIIASNSRLDPFNKSGRIILLNSCTSTITAHPTISPDMVGGCRGEEIEIKAEPGHANYYWSNLERSASIKVGDNGDYFYQLADDQGCLGPSSDTVSAQFDYSPPSPPVVAPYCFINKCIGQTITLSINSFNANVEWSTGAITSSITVDNAGEYSVRQISEEGCYSAPSVIQVTEVDMPSPIPPSITIEGSTTFCSGEHVILSAPPGYANYKWSNGEKGRSIGVTRSGEYFVEVEGANSCPIPPSETVSTTRTSRPNRPNIFHNTGILFSGSSFGGQWYFNGEDIPNATSGSITPTNSGFYTVQTANGQCLSEVSAPYLLILTSDQTLERRGGVKCFPNPATDQITISLDFDLAERHTLIIRSVSGKIVNKQVLPHGGNHFRHSLQKAAKGMYLLEIRNSLFELVYIQKLVVE